MKIFITDDDMCTTQKLNLSRVQKWLVKNKCTIVDDKESADQILCVTCNGWKLLEENSYERIRDLSQYHDKTIVMGCVVDAHEQKVNTLFKGKTVKTKSKNALSFEGIEDYFPSFQVKLNDIPAQTEFRRKIDYRDYNPRRVFINIAEGCSFACSFCTHKPGLGPRRSRTLVDILNQINRANKTGIDVLHLMGMETALWGIEFKSNYVELLDAVLKIPGGFEIHIAQFQPHGLKLYGSDLAKLMSNKRVTDIQIPIQSTSDRIMKMMNRKNHSKIISPFLKAIRKDNIRTTLRTDLIVAWPSETIEERLHSLDYAAEHFDEIAVYAIELSEDLPAWKYQSQAYSPKEAEEIVKFSKNYLNNKNVVIHSGQQDDATMYEVEQKRKQLRMNKLLSISQNNL